jgi:DNA-binding transcriptional LysR family regulator
MVSRALVPSLRNVDIRLVRIFITVTECGGFAASELELNIGRSTISKHISDLEFRIGLKLCNRGPAGFSLTEEGEQSLVAAHQMLGSLDSFQSQIDNIHTKLTGTLKLGLCDQSTTNPKAQIHQAIQAFDDLAPDVSLEIALGTPSILETRIVEGSIDLAIVPIHRSSTMISYTPLYTEHMTLYCGEGHPLFDAPEDASFEDLRVAEYKYAGYAFNSPNMKAGRTLGFQRSARVQEEEALSLLIQSGRYLGYLADHVAETFVTKGSVRPVASADTGYTSTFAAITRKKPEADRKTKEFMKCLTRVHGTVT